MEVWLDSRSKLNDQGEDINNAQDKMVDVIEVLSNCQKQLLKENSNNCIDNFRLVNKKNYI